MNNRTAKAPVLLVRLEDIVYGQYTLPMAIDDEANLYMTYPATESILNYGSDNFRKILGSKSLNLLLGERLITGKYKGKVTNKTTVGTPDVNLISFELFLSVAAVRSRENDDVLQLLISGFGDSLRSLALKQFGKTVSDEDRQQWLENRHKSKAAFWDLGDAIKLYKEDHPERSDRYRQHVYSNCQDAINRGLFGKDASTIRIELGIKTGELLRDHYGQSALKRIELIQAVAAANIVNLDVEPLQAVKSALVVFNFEVIGYAE